jgi:hypothetical protein
VWIVPDDADTDVATGSSCAYDTIVMSQGGSEHYAGREIRRVCCGDRLNPQPKPDIQHATQFVLAKIVPITTIDIGPASMNKMSNPCLPKIVSSGSLPGANNPTCRY